MSQLKAAFLACLFILPIGQARAAVVTFEVSGGGLAPVDHYYVSAPLSGTLTVDSDSGLFSSANLFLTEWFTNVVSHSSGQPAPYDISIKSATSADVLNLVLDVAPLALISNQGGSIVGGSGSAGGLAFFNIAGQVSPIAGEPSAVPIPTALPLFATGLAL